MNDRFSLQRLVPNELKHIVLKRDGDTCRMCGQTTADKDPYDGKAVRMEIGVFVPLAHGGKVTQSNLRAICSTCAKGLEELPFTRPPTARTLIKYLERLPQEELKTVFESLSLHG